MIRYEEVVDDDHKRQSGKQQKQQTAHDWEYYKAKNVFDDGTLTYFW